MTKDDNQELIELMGRLGFKEFIDNDEEFWQEKATDGFYEHYVNDQCGGYLPQTICIGLAKKILKEVEKAELRGKIDFINRELLDNHPEDWSGSLTNYCWQIREEMEAQLQALEQEGK